MNFLTLLKGLYSPHPLIHNIVCVKTYIKNGAMATMDSGSHWYTLYHYIRDHLVFKLAGRIYQ